jgi:succinoglycan biosynthesis protein ExoM
MHVAICIATFKRPRLLQKLLRGLAQLRFVKVATPEITVIVVDNDTSGTASEICYSTILPWHMNYLIEPKRGTAP